MPLPDADSIRITCVFGGNNVPTGAVSTCEFEKTSELITAWQEPVVAAYRALHRDLAVNSVGLTELLIKTGPEATGPTQQLAVNEAGNQGSDASSPAVSLLVRKNLALYSGRFAGRQFWPGLSDAAYNESGDLQTVNREVYQESWDTWFAAINAVGLVPVVYGNDTEPRTVSAFTVQGRIATQRRRLRR